jgi:GTP cyclohydrolase-4
MPGKKDSLPESKPARIFLGLGTNMGDRRLNLEKALHALSQKIEVSKVSRLYDTAPVGNTRQARFLNLACEAETVLNAPELLAFAKTIEKNMGRLPGPVNSPRPIDIDILFYNNLVINTPELVIPHPRLAERAFVLVPLAEIAPDLVHPISGQKIKDTLTELQWEKDSVIDAGVLRGETCMK